jgi:hypothetical protein
VAWAPCRANDGTRAGVSGGCCRPVIAIKFSYKGPSTLGWWAFYRAFLPNETLGSADWRARFVQSLAWHVV